MNAIRKELLDRLRQIPDLPASASELLRIINYPEHDMHDIVNIIHCDPVMTSRILKVANCAAYSVSGAITTIDRAVALLGESMLVGIVLAEASSVLHRAELPGYGAEPGDLWQHDLRTAIAARNLARHATTPVEADLAFTCGLLHDLGKTLLSSALAEVFTEVKSALLVDSADYLAIERDLLGITHPELGRALAEKWRLPHPLPEAMALHHAPAEAPANCRHLLYAVHLGDFTAMMAGFGTGVDTLRYRIESAYPRYIAIDQDALVQVMIQVEDEFQALKEGFFSAD
ncbi:MAG: HDOD domain-containing protein [Thermodesulfobacteriota bacterium]